jgi:hypothetical protein
MDNHLVSNNDPIGLFFSQIFIKDMVNLFARTKITTSFYFTLGKMYSLELIRPFPTEINLIIASGACLRPEEEQHRGRLFDV